MANATVYCCWIGIPSIAAASRSWATARTARPSDVRASTRPSAGERHGGDEDQRDLHARQRHAADPQQRALIRRVERLALAAPHPQRGVLHHEQQAERDRRRGGRVGSHPAIGEQLGGDRDHAPRRDARERRDEEGDSVVDRLARDVRGEHDDAGMGEVRDLHHAVHEGQPDGDHREQRAEEDPVDQYLTHAVGAAIRSESIRTGRRRTPGRRRRRRRRRRASPS